MKRLVAVSILGFIWSSLVHEVHSKSYDIEFVRMEKMNDTNDLFEYNLKSVEKIDKSSLKVNCDVSLKIDLDKDYHYWIIVYFNKDFKEEFDKPMVQLPKRDICEFLDTTYRDHMWERIKDFSNFPEPGTCPVKANEYYLKDYIFDGERFKAMMMPGLARVDMFVSQDHGDSHITKNGVRIFVKVIKADD